MKHYSLRTPSRLCGSERTCCEFQWFLSTDNRVADVPELNGLTQQGPTRSFPAGGIDGASVDFVCALRSSREITNHQDDRAMQYRGSNFSLKHSPVIPGGSIDQLLN